jgi:uncharacterized Zn-finger protein
MAENVNSEQDELEPIDAMEGSFLDVSRTEEVETCSQRQNRCFTCDHCHKSFRKKYNLNRHVQTHTNDIKYKCVSCNQYFLTEEKREAHMSKNHYDQDTLCDICGSLFGRKNDLKVHLKKHTEDPSNNMCPFEGCRRSFSRYAQYQDHLNAHTGVKPYKCSNCVATFSCRYRKRRHETYRIHLWDLQPSLPKCW